MDKNMVLIPLEMFQDILKKAEQRDIILRFADKEKYTCVDKEDIFKICGRTAVKEEDTDNDGEPDANR